LGEKGGRWGGREVGVELGSSIKKMAHPDRPWVVVPGTILAVGSGSGVGVGEKRDSARRPADAVSCGLRASSSTVPRGFCFKPKGHFSTPTKLHNKRGGLAKPHSTFSVVGEGEGFRASHKKMF
jgi:hypothetical protein